MKGAIAHRRRTGSSRSKLDKKSKTTLDSSNQGWTNDDYNELYAPVLEPSERDDEELGYLPTEGDKKNATLLGLAASRQHQHWEKFSARLLRHGYWSRLGDLAKSLNAMPDDIAVIYDRIQKNMTYKMDPATRLRYYKEFTRTALGSMVLRFSEVLSIADDVQFPFIGG